MIIVHHLNVSRSHRIVWLLEELGLPYKVVHYKRDSKTKLAPSELLAVHPLGISPVIQDGDLTLAESGAIIEYILAKYGNGKLKPKEGTPEWAQYLFWMHFGEGTLMPQSSIRLVWDIIHARSPFFARKIIGLARGQLYKSFLDERLFRAFDYLNATLAKHPFLVGQELTGADIQTGFIFILSDFGLKNFRGELEQKYPHLAAYVETLRQRPAFKKTLEICGPIGREAFVAA